MSQRISIILIGVLSFCLIHVAEPPAGLASASATGNFEFTGQVAFETVDRDSNGLAEALAANVEFRVLETGKYAIEGTLGHQGSLISEVPRLHSSMFTSYFFDGSPGTYVARLEFSGEDIFEHGQNGPYDLELWATGSSGIEDTLECFTPSFDYTSFGELMASLTSATDRGVDLDGDGKYDVLRVTAHAAVRAPGTFAVWAGLSGDQTSIASAGRDVSLQIGDRIFELDFPGVKIRKKNIDGPYEVSVTIMDTVVFNPSSIEDTTAAYSASDFDLSALIPTGNHSDYGLDVDSDGAYDILGVFVSSAALINKVRAW